MFFCRLFYPNLYNDNEDASLQKNNNQKKTKNKTRISIFSPVVKEGRPTGFSTTLHNLPRTTYPFSVLVVVSDFPSRSPGLPHARLVRHARGSSLFHTKTLIKTTSGPRPSVPDDVI